MRIRSVPRIVAGAAIMFVAGSPTDIVRGQRQDTTRWPAQVPIAWEDSALAALEVPLADASHSPVHVSAAKSLPAASAPRLQELSNLRARTRAGWISRVAATTGAPHRVRRQCAEH